MTPRGIGVISFSVAVCFCALRLAYVGGGPGTFVLAGSDWTDKTTAPAGLPVLSGPGFDGQFFYRLALRPSAVGLAAEHGIRLDRPYRSGRIGYPALAWVGSLGGHERLVPWALIAVNVAAMGALGWIGASLALSRKRNAAWGLVIAAYWGFGIVLGRDLSELVAATAVFGAVLLVSRRKIAAAGALLILAVLTREQCVLTVAALAVGLGVAELRTGRRAGAARAIATIAIPPAVAFLTWQLWVSRTTDKLPALSSSGATVVAPFTGIAKSIGGWWSAFGTGVGASLPILGALGIAVLCIGVIASGGLTVSWRDRPWEPLAGATALVVLVCSSPFVLAAPADFRQSAELVGFAWLVLFVAPDRRRTFWPLALVAPLTILTFMFRAVVL